MGEPTTEGRKGFRTGARLGRFVLGPVVARGGMGELYLARTRGAAGFTKLFALKVLLPQIADDPELVAMFLHEARIAARLDHPNIAAVIDLGEMEGEYYIAMEYVHGRDLRAVLQHGKVPLAAALAIADRLCAGLHYAHNAVDANGDALRVIHRDVSPANVIVRYDGEIKIVDFGIAKASTGTKLTRTGMLKGKPGYMSPEQCLDAPVDHRSDVWGIAVLLYEMTTGRKLFVGDNDYAIMGQVLRAEIDAPSSIDAGYSAALEAIVLRGLARDPAERFASALAMQEALVDFAREAGVTPSTAATAEHVRSLFGSPAVPNVAIVESEAAAPNQRRRWWPVAIGGSIAAIGIAIALQRPAEAETERPAAASPATTPAAAKDHAAPVAATPATDERAAAAPPTAPALAPAHPNDTDTPRKSTHRRAAPRRHKGKPDDAEPKTRDLDALLPGSYR